MKPSTTLSSMALVVGIVALALSVSARKPLSEAEIDAAVGAALAKREQAWVEKHAPNFKVMYSELGTAEYMTDDWSPATLEELIAPLVRIISEMAEQ